MASYPIIGKKTIYIDDMVISPDYVADEAATITLTPATTEVASQTGTINVPNGSYSEMSFEINVICPSVRYLGMLFPDLYHNAAFKRVIGGKLSETGQVRFGSSDCVSNTPRDIIIHNVCDGDSSAQDFRIPQALITAGGEFSVSLSDPFKVTLSGTMTPGANGAVVMGELDLDTPSYFDEEQGTIVAKTITPTALMVSPSSVSGAKGTSKIVNVTMLPEGATGTVTATSTSTTTATVSDNGDGSWKINLLAAGSTTVTFKAGTVSKTVNVTVTA